MSKLTRVQLLTVSTAPYHKYQKVQRQTVTKWGYEYTVLGQNVKWKGFSTKMDLLRNYCAKVSDEVAKSTLFVVIDAYDLLICGPPDDLLNAFKQFKSPIVVGAETVCFGNCQPSSCPLGSAKGPFNNPNGGCVMGRATDLFQLYDWEFKNYPADDQVALSRYRNAHCGRVALDRTASIVWNAQTDVTSIPNEIQFMPEGRIQIRKTQTNPCIAHCPFIFADLGYRWDTLAAHILPAYVRPHTKMDLMHSLVQHLTKTLKTNKTFFVLAMSISYGSLLALVFLGFLLIWGFQNVRLILHNLEYGTSSSS